MIDPNYFRQYVQQFSLLVVRCSSKRSSKLTFHRYQDSYLIMFKQPSLEKGLIDSDWNVVETKGVDDTGVDRI